MAILELDKLYQYLETLRNAAVRTEVREAVDNFKQQLLSRTDANGHKLPVINLVSGIRLPVLQRCGPNLTYVVTIDDLKELVNNLELESKDPRMQDAVKNIREEIKQMESN